ncbi:heavy-metal-associated domain-containing protein [Streptomyces profundus]|uniref:heavy-metal-associated domain-containing protein n=1 Tax=Streptomyces profundus TaxID=2867410 RepID=UPI001D16F0CD|nr:heavy metal-associated domain-containing protein [Streptomyces sp. MA3_2.13]UED85369.1 heavy-metal-associated domain-containing protein [Streptomyces sp. MA3_2.13]
MSAEVSAVVAEYRVLGMACRRCAGMVGGQVRRLAGVRDVAVDVRSETVRVSSEHLLNEAELAAVLADSGYRLVRADASGEREEGGGAPVGGAADAPVRPEER